MKITDKQKTEFLLTLAKEHYSQADEYHAWKSKKDKWHFGHSNDQELQHGQGNNTIIDDSMLEILMNREVVNNLDIANVSQQRELFDAILNFSEELPMCTEDYHRSELWEKYKALNCG